MTLTYAKKENKRYRYYVCNNHLRGKGCESINRTIVAGEVEKEAMRKTEQLYENGKEWKNLSPGKQKEVVKKLIKGVMVKEEGIEVSSEDKVEFIPIGSIKKGNKCTVVEPEGKTNNALLKAVVRAHLWKRQLEGGKYVSVGGLSAKINIGIALFTIIRTDRNMLLACYSHKHISYRIRTIIRKAITPSISYPKL